jgi:hypothetical protein
VVSFFGAAAIGEMRMVCPFITSTDSGGASWGAEPADWGEMRTVSPEVGAGCGAGLKRTVSRFTTGASLGFEGNVIRTVSFLGVLSGGGVPEGVSSAIVIEFIFSISLWGFYVNSIVALGEMEFRK